MFKTLFKKKQVEKEAIESPETTGSIGFPDNVAKEFYSVLMTLGSGDFVPIHPLSNDFRILYALAFPDFERYLTTKHIEGREHFKSTEPEIIKDTAISFGDEAFKNLGFHESGKNFNTLDVDDMRKLYIEAGRDLYKIISPTETLCGNVLQPKTEGNKQDLIKNPFSLTKQQARDVCHVSLALCNGVPQRQSKAVLHTLGILGAGFLNIREYTNSYNTTLSEGSNGITLQDGFREHLIPFFEGCSDVASKTVGHNMNEPQNNLDPKEIEVFCIELGYTLARSVFSVDR